MLKTIVQVLLVLAFAARIASGAEGGAETAHPAHTITIVDGELIHPSTLTMRSGDVLEFKNYSAQPMMLRFTEPADPVDKIRCRAISAGGALANPDWQLDDSRAEPQLSAIIPPGRSASSCLLAPGRYAFVMKQIPRDVRAEGASLGNKGVLTVVE
jgi:hypothetical protein